MVCHRKLPLHEKQILTGYFDFNGVFKFYSSPVLCIKLHHIYKFLLLFIRIHYVNEPATRANSFLFNLYPIRMPVDNTGMTIGTVGRVIHARNVANIHIFQSNIQGKLASFYQGLRRGRCVILPFISGIKADKCKGVNSPVFCSIHSNSHRSSSRESFSPGMIRVVISKCFFKV